MSPISVPPTDGSIPVLPNFVDFQAKCNPTSEWVRLAPDSDFPGLTLTFAEAADASHRAARVFSPDGTHSKGETVALLVNCDTILYI